MFGLRSKSLRRQRDDPDRRADQLRSHFNKVSNKSFKARRPRSYQPWLTMSFLILAIIATAYIALPALSPWPRMVTFRHILAAANCDTSRALGLAPARKGEPGYWRKLDADRDGIACEPWPR